MIRLIAAFFLSCWPLAALSQTPQRTAIGPLELAIQSVTFADTLLGDAAPAGARFGVVAGTLKNSADTIVALPAAQRIFAVAIDGRYSIPHPITMDLPRGLWAETQVAAGETRPIEIAFAVPAAASGALELAIYGVANGSSVMRLTAPAQEPAPTIATIEVGGLRLTARDVNRSADKVTVTIDATSMRGPGVLNARLADFLSVKLADGSVLKPDMTSQAFGNTRSFVPGLALRGQIEFTLPERAEAAAIVVEMGNAKGELALRAVTAPPVTAAGQPSLSAARPAQPGAPIAQSPPAAPAAPRLSDARAPLVPSLTPAAAFPAHVNIANAALGTRVIASAPVLEQGRWGLRAVNDGLVADETGTLTETAGFATMDANPSAIMFAFPGAEPVEISGLAIDLSIQTAWNGRSQVYGAMNDRLKRFSVSVSDAGADGPWREVLASSELRPERGLQAVKLPEPVRARALRVDLLQNFGGRSTRFGEIEVYGPLASLATILSATAHPSVIDRRLGGGITDFTSADAAASVGQLNDATPAGWQAGSKQLPQRLTFAMPQGCVAEVERIEIIKDPAAPAGSFPSAVKLETGVSDDSVNLIEQGVHELPDAPDGSAISLPAPLKIRHFRLSVTATHGGVVPRIGEVRVLERDPKVTGRSVLQLDPSCNGSLAPTEERALTAEVTEQEPNDRQSDANPLKAATAIAGHHEPDQDIDHFAFDVSGPGPRIVTIRREGAPSLRSRLDLLDQTSAVAQTRSPRDNRTEDTFSWRLEPGPWTLRTAIPETSVLMLFDTSGSMRDAVALLRQAADGYVAAAKDHEVIGAMGFSGSVRDLSPFTRDRDAVRTAIRSGVNADGGTSLYQGILAALAKFKDREGSKAIVLISDGADSTDGRRRAEAWTAIANSGVRIYTIALGGDLQVYSAALGAKPAQMLRAWAGATGGRYIEVADAGGLARAYQRIADDLRAQMSYRLTVRPETGAGQLNIVETGQRIGGVGAPQRVGLILDASGSMRAKLPDGQTKIDAAKRVLLDMISGLPDGVQVGLRVYGNTQPANPKPASCNDTQLALPFQPLDRYLASLVIRAIEPKGQTPIGRSIAAMIDRDLQRAQGTRLLVLVTDGIETCDESVDLPNHPFNVVKRIRNQGTDLRLNVVGYDVTDNPTRAFLQQLALDGGGTYFSARGANGLADSLRSAMAVNYDVLDAAGSIIVTGKVGEVVGVPEGVYAVRVASTPQIRVENVEIRLGQVTRLGLRKEGDEVGIERKLINAVPVAAGGTLPTATSPQSAPPTQSAQVLAPSGSAVKADAPQPPLDGICHQWGTNLVSNAATCVSSRLASGTTQSYGPDHLKGSSGGAWCEGVAGTGVGQWIRETYPIPMTVRRIVIENGYTRTADTFRNNGRVRRLRIETSDGVRMSAQLRDTTEAQTITLPRAAQATFVLLTIEEVVPGARGTDTCLSTVLVDLENR